MNRHIVTLTALGALALSGCEDEAPPAPPPPAPAAGAAGGGPASPGGPNRNRRNPADDPPPPMQISDTTFVSDINRARDPFKSYFNNFVVSNTARLDVFRDVKLSRYSLDDLRLVAVIIGTDSPYAMVVDPTRAGTVLRRGMYVGRQEFVQTPQGGYPTHWRVARIEPGRYHQSAGGEFEEIGAQVVFERSNALDSNAQVVERTLTLNARAGMQTNAPSGPVGPIPGLAGPTPGYLPSNLGGVGAGSANGAILGTQQTVQQAVNGNNPVSPPPPQTTVVVQVPPTQPGAAQPVPPSTAPPPVQVYNGSAATNPPR